MAADVQRLRACGEHGRGPAAAEAMAAVPTGFCGLPGGPADAHRAVTMAPMACGRRRPSRLLPPETAGAVAASDAIGLT